MSETMLYHAGKQMFEIPEIRVTKYTKDFSWGFYCTKDLTQAIRWANRGFGEPVVNKYEYHEAGNPTHQISFHTQKALECLKYKGSEVVYDSEE